MASQADGVLRLMKMSMNNLDRLAKMVQGAKEAQDLLEGLNQDLQNTANRLEARRKKGEFGDRIKYLEEQYFSERSAVAAGTQSVLKTYSDLAESAGVTIPNLVGTLALVKQTLETAAEGERTKRAAAQPSHAQRSYTQYSSSQSPPPAAMPASRPSTSNAQSLAIRPKRQQVRSPDPRFREVQAPASSSSDQHRSGRKRD